MSNNLINRCKMINSMFNHLALISGRTDKEIYVDTYKKLHPKIVKDLDFCFEVLAGKYKLGYTFIITKDCGLDSENYKGLNIRSFYKKLQELPATDAGILLASRITPSEVNGFISMLVNREFRLGYSNKQSMITNLSPMLAKKYPETFKGEYTYYIQEKLDGNRCIAYYDFNEDKWCFQSRSGKELKVNFDMSWAEKRFIYDGEIMNKSHTLTSDFNKTSGAINSKFGDKSGLHYFIYDIVDVTREYKDRLAHLMVYQDTGKDCTILPVLDEVTLYPNIEYNWKLDEWLDKITGKGGEGIILRDPHGWYEHKRSNYLLKYKKTQTMDLRIVDWNEGNGKYAGAIGSFFCQTDDGTIQANVSGMPDEMHFSNPNDWIGRVIEVAYFSISQSSNNSYKSLRFPRLKRIRNDKNETSIY